METTNRKNYFREKFSTLLIFFFFSFSLSSQVQADGASVEILDRTALRVCSDPNNLPFSNQKQEGFENKIANLIAEELKISVEYYWFPQGMGFVRNTLKARNCDIIIGISLTNELLQNTNPYYESTYVMVYRKDAKVKPKSIKDPVIKNLKKGIIVNTPPVTALIANKMFKNFKSFRLLVDTRNFSPNRDMVKDLLKGELDIAFMWGPIGGYYVKKHSDELEYIRLQTKDYGIKMDYQITMGMRQGEKEWKRQINRIIRKKADEIDQILLSYGVPLIKK